LMQRTECPEVAGRRGSVAGMVMIVCSCTVISDRDIEGALIEILSRSDAVIPTPGVVYRHLSRRMRCCGCAPLAISTIYSIVDRLEREGRVCPCACASAKSSLSRLGRNRVSTPGDNSLLIAAE
jgi:hypothetical protein